MWAPLHPTHHNILLQRAEAKDFPQINQQQQLQAPANSTTKKTKLTAAYHPQLLLQGCF
jgi:hypothetical protein